MNDLRGTGKSAFLGSVLVLSSGAFAPLWLNSSQQDASVHGDARLQIVWFCIDLIVGFLLMLRYRSALSALNANKPLLLLTATCFVSAIWSENPEVTLRKAAALAGTTLIGLLLAIDFTPHDQLRIVALALSFVAAVSIIVSLFIPHTFPPTEFAGGSWNGIFSHKNLLGRTMSLGALTFLSLDCRKLTTATCAFAGLSICLCALLGSHSQTAVVVTLTIAACLLLSRLLRLKWREAIGLTLLLIVCLAPLFWIAFAHPGEMTQLLHRNATLTGRSRIWNYSELSFAKHAWLGYGYAGFWWVSRDSLQALAWIGYKTPHAHNGFLDLGLQLGIVGLALFAVAWIVAARNAALGYLAFPDSTTRWRLLFFVFILLYSLTESSLLAPNSLLWILFVAAVFTPVRPALYSPDSL